MSTQYTIFNIKKKITLIYPQTAAMGFCSKGLKNEFETAEVNELSVFEPLKFYCNRSRKMRMINCCCMVVVLLFYVHGKHLRSYRDGQLT